VATAPAGQGQDLIARARRGELLGGWTDEAGAEDDHGNGQHERDDEGDPVRTCTWSRTARTQAMAAAEFSICADEPAMEARPAPEPNGAAGRPGAPGAG